MPDGAPLRSRPKCAHPDEFPADCLNRCPLPQPAGTSIPACHCSLLSQDHESQSASPRIGCRQVHRRRQATLAHRLNHDVMKAYNQATGRLTAICNRSRAAASRPAARLRRDPGTSRGCQDSQDIGARSPFHRRALVLTTRYVSRAAVVGPHVEFSQRMGIAKAGVG